MPDPRRSEFGDFLRSRRAKLNPKSVGLADGRIRRAPGLRREEVAELAGIGVDWYIRLEQGRAVSPSLTTIDALARALRLSKVEHAHLRALASGANRRAFTQKPFPRPFETGRVPQSAGLHHGSTVGCPCVEQGCRRHFCLRSSAGTRSQHSRLHVLNPGTRRLFGSGWTEEAKRVVAQFRATHDLWAGDPAFVELLTRLRNGSPEFAEWWEAHDIRGGAGGVKRLRHPKKGMMRLPMQVSRPMTIPT